MKFWIPHNYWRCEASFAWLINKIYRLIWLSISFFAVLMWLHHEFCNFLQLLKIWRAIKKKMEYIYRLIIPTFCAFFIFKCGIIALATIHTILLNSPTCIMNFSSVCDHGQLDVSLYGKIDAISRLITTYFKTFFTGIYFATV